MVQKWEGNRNAYKVWGEKPKGMRLLGRSRCGLEDNIKTDLKERHIYIKINIDI